MLPALYAVCLLSSCGNQSVKFTLPKDYEPITTDAADYSALQGVTYQTNADGSFAYEVDSKTQKALLEAVRQDYENTRQEWLKSEYMPNLTDIVANDDFTHITVKTSLESEKLSAEGTLHISLYMFCELYSVFSGKESFDYVIETVNESGKVLKKVTSGDIQRMKEKLEALENRKSTTT